MKNERVAKEEKSDRLLQWRSPGTSALSQPVPDPWILPVSIRGEFV